MFILTETGRNKVKSFIAECTAKRKEILDAGEDTPLTATENWSMATIV